MGIVDGAAKGAAAGSPFGPAGALVGAGIGVLGGIAGAVGANQRSQKNKGLINAAYTRGRQRLNLNQADERQSSAERLGARGLAQGGSVRLGGIARPAAFRAGYNGTGPINELSKRFTGLGYDPGTGTNVTGAHSLGEQYTADQGREQTLEQQDMATERDNALKANNDERTNAYVNAAIGGVSSAVNGYNAVSAYNDAYQKPKDPRDMSGGAWGGIDPVRPLEFGAWAPRAVDQFNIYRNQG